MDSGPITIATPRVEPVIRKTPGVCGGDACIDRTRVPVWLVVEMRNTGWTEMEMLEDFPHLNLPALHAAWQYYDSNKAEIDAAIARQNADEPE